MSRGIWVSDTEFVRFSENSDPVDMSGHIATRLRVGDLSGMFGILPNPDPILKRMGRQVEVYKELLVDGMVKSGVRRRKAAVVSMERGFDRQTKAPARVVRNLESIFADLPIERMVRNLVMGGMYGYAVAEVIWGKVGGMVVPVDVQAKPPAWFAFDGDNKLVLRDLQHVSGMPMPDRKFLVVGNERDYANPYGEADLASCFWPVAFRKGGLKFWVTFAEKYGMPWAVGKQPRSASSKDADSLADKLEAMVRDAVAVIPDDSSVDLLQSQTTANADMYEQLLMYCSREISIALLGNNQSTEMQSNRASAQAAAEVEHELRDADADMVAEGLTQLARWIVDVNWPSSVAPAYAFWEQERIDQAQVERDSKLTQAGVPLTPAYWMRTYNLQPGDIDLARFAAPGQPAPGAPGAAADSAAGVALAEAGAVPPDQAALDEAVANLPAADIQAAMATMLQPALDAIATADTPDQVLAALAEAYPRMDTTALETLLQRALFVSDLVGRNGVATEAQAADQGD